MKLTRELKVIGPRKNEIISSIENRINKSTTEDELRKIMEEVRKENYSFDLFFNYGFGHNHMWLSNKDKERVLIVTF